MPGHMDVKGMSDDVRALVNRVRRGEEIVLTEDGRAVARLGPPDPADGMHGPEGDLTDEEKVRRRKTLIGLFEGQGYWVADDAFEPDEELIESFYTDDPHLQLRPGQGGRGENGGIP